MALFALLFAVRVNARVFVTSSCNEKLNRAKALGAAGGVNYKSDPAWSRTLQQMAGGPIDTVIDGAGGEENWKTFSKVVSYGGIIVSYGATAGLLRVFF